DVEALRTVGTESLEELRRSLRLLVRDLRTELALDPLQAFVRDCVPAAVVDRAGRQQSGPERFRRRRRGGGAGRRAFAPRLTGKNGEKSAEEQASFHGGGL